MPVMLRADQHRAWLNPVAQPDELAGLLNARPDVTGYKVSSRVGNVRNDDAELLEALEAG